jgi:hypothetical protein
MLNEQNLSKAGIIAISVGLLMSIFYFINRKKFRDKKWINGWNVFAIFVLISWVPANLFVQRHNFSLISAIEHNDLTRAEDAIEKGADINYPFRGGDTFLHVVARNNGDLKVAKFLIEKGVSVNKKNDDKLTAIDIAKQYNNKELYDYLKSLLEKSSNP